MNKAQLMQSQISIAKRIDSSSVKEVGKAVYSLHEAPPHVMMLINTVHPGASFTDRMNGPDRNFYFF